MDANEKDFAARSRQLKHKTSAGASDGRPVSILHDLYIPVLRRSACYDRMAGCFRSTSLAAASQGFSAFAEGGRFSVLFPCIAWGFIPMRNS